MSFAQIHRMLTALRIDDENDWRKFRRIAYEVWRKGAKNPPDEEKYMPIGRVDVKVMTEEQLDEIWEKYGKRN